LKDLFSKSIYSAANSVSCLKFVALPTKINFQFGEVCIRVGSVHVEY
jgi:hypothetical protein